MVGRKHWQNAIIRTFKNSSIVLRVASTILFDARNKHQRVRLDEQAIAYQTCTTIKQTKYGLRKLIKAGAITIKGAPPYIYLRADVITKADKRRYFEADALHVATIKVRNPFGGHFIGVVEDTLSGSTFTKRFDHPDPAREWAKNKVRGMYHPVIFTFQRSKDVYKAKCREKGSFAA